MSLKITPNAVERQHLEFSFGKKLCMEERVWKDV